ncbi:histidine--tRNA ligase [Auraticoccus sp. F435]|uniref:Histidine--tRNA ligase n=1 Tax=Auraticoccus cholistanensis TaxID=2656650 RepID=A0A6A9UWJ7_9ACTN|nr:histidine--tRNA ligase [Auraticoccus cholistanensis]MVA75944.1 histidine--tRNA ligase [Auraticoccus cholistanensis]
MSRLSAMSGYPEFLPGQRMVEQQVLQVLRETFELHGYAPIETRAVEPMSQLARKGEIDKEIYVVRRLHATDEEAATGPDQLGLHYDLTVPFARYVQEFGGRLSFPFRRYQIQRVWRGERPQEGRYREFTQADIDVVGAERLADHHDLEIPLVALEAFERLHTELGLPAVRMRVNNRKLAEGFYRGLGVTEPAAVLQRVDKLDKIGADKVRALLVEEVGLAQDAADACLQLSQITSPDSSFVDRVRALGVEHPLLEEGLELLSTLVAAAAERVPGRLVADLSIARGLDYYTGTVYETELAGHESMGSVGSGGRYDSLASDGRTTYPGVGFSFGVTRMLAPLFARDALRASRPVPSAVLVAVDTEETRGAAEQVAAALRARRISCEVAPRADRFGKQIRFAERRGIPFVWFGGVEGQVKDIRSGDQLDADARRWEPPAEDLRPRVLTD